MCNTNADRLKVTIVNSFRAGVFTRQQVQTAWQTAYPKHRFDTLVMSDYCVNTISGYRTMPEKNRFLFWIEKGVFRMYDPKRDGQWQRINDKIAQIDC